MNDVVRLAVLGAGHRGSDVYGGYCLAHPDQGRVVAVAEPDPERRARFAAAHAIPPARAFTGWRELLRAGRLCDAVVVATPDRLRVSPAVAALRAGYDVLLEKPIAALPGEVEQIRAAAAAAPGSVTVAHGLRYTPFFITVKSLVDGGAIGELVQIQHAENIGYWHFAHSYVRGNWRRVGEASAMLLAKACHDLDVLRWLAGAPCRSVASFGGLRHFRPEHAPPGAPARCTDGCPAANDCPFYAPRLYVERLADHPEWPVSVVSPDPSLEARWAALRNGPYGRCVYRCDNDAADHQAVIASFANGVVASLTVSGFTADNTRTLKLMGTRGELRGRLDTGEIEVRRFLPGKETVESSQWDRDRYGRAAFASDEVYTVQARPEGYDHDVDGHHEGGDAGLMRAFLAHVRARRAGRPDPGVQTSLEESIESHVMAFAAERSRLEGRVVSL
jgi:predicted dehydrogenase